MKKHERTKKEPLFHIVKRDSLPAGKKVALYAGAIFLGLPSGIQFLFVHKDCILSFLLFLREYGAVLTVHKIFCSVQLMVSCHCTERIIRFLMGTSKGVIGLIIAWEI